MLNRLQTVGPPLHSSSSSLIQFSTIEEFDILTYLKFRVRPRFLDQVGHETMYASSGNKHFFTKSCHRQTYQIYEQSRQKLGTILENKVSKISKTVFDKS